MRQYYEIKRKYPDVVLLYRMGDFYETFDEDAKLTAEVLGITLTSRANGKASQVPLAGFPYHALDSYLYKYLDSGHRVAICEQVEDPKQAKGIVKREVVEVATPGSAMSEHFLSAKEANFLVALAPGEDDAYGLAFIDVSTGRFEAMEIQGGQLNSLMATLDPREILLAENDEVSQSLLKLDGTLFSRVEDWVYHHEFARNELLKKFNTRSLRGFGLEKLALATAAAGAILYYLQQYQGRELTHVTRIRSLSMADWMVLDNDTLRNLELFHSMSGRQRGTLIDCLDVTVSAAGGRLLREWMQKPLLKRDRIQARLDKVQRLLECDSERESIRELLKQCVDLERSLARLGTNRASARDLAGIRFTLEKLPELKTQIEQMEQETAVFSSEESSDLTSLAATIASRIVDEPPLSVKQGGMIRDGVDAELDEIRGIARNAKEWLTAFQKSERERLGIPSLKVGYNKVFGYYIEITHTHKDRVPEDYIRKQTLVNSERFITEELKEYEEKVLTAEERYTARELELFNALQQEVLAFSSAIQTQAAFLAQLDVLGCFAQLAHDRHYCRPDLDESLGLEIHNGRHPVIEQTLPIDEAFIPNDLVADALQDQILLITGPNMAGKSTYLRQAGLIVLMAQMGAYIPADSARIGIVDRIFTRVGASDNLTGGESTFMVEMNETANILNNATQRSLILLDEIGRGTSTYDGLAIAWALVEYLHGRTEQAARTLFATHYHELVSLEKVLDRVKNYTIAVREFDDQVIFLRKIIPGGADKSYGIHVAQMAGVPLPVIQRANEILQSLDSGEVAVRSDTIAETVPSLDMNQLSLFEKQEQILRQRLQEIDINHLTPMDAIRLVDELLKEIHGK